MTKGIGYIEVKRRERGVGFDCRQVKELRHPGVAVRAQLPPKSTADTDESGTQQPYREELRRPRRAVRASEELPAQALSCCRLTLWLQQTTQQAPDTP
ncbi:hypothetical protein NDU88_005061 [Pleurodeles waltl]|uniref:Uncharacterized protein n=1 Tax=Pleurodeles waltl TaxID=8319 RepID=A0AAV7WWU6_PLEWA|nr:hypothetical protein NDU88_005061 [Pleurodeles waltl]